jgi:glycosyltransferase 2 family protein
MIRPRLPKSRSARAVVVVLAAVGGAGLLWWRGPAWSQVGQSFTNVRWEWVVVALALNLFSVLVRALCWWAILGQAIPPPRLGYATVLSGYAIGLMANAVLPGRVGEVARVAVLRRKLNAERGLWPTLLGTVVAHRLFDLIPAAVLVGWVIVAARMPTWAFSSLVTVIAIGAALFLVGAVGARRRERRLRLGTVGPVRRAIVFARQGLAVLRAPRTSAVAVVLQTLGWLCQLLAVWAALRAFHIYLPFAAAGLVLALMNVANILPLWPGNVGLLQAAIALPLVGYGVRYAHGFAYGIGLQAIEASVGVAYGLVFFAREGISFAALREIPNQEEKV